jgi:anhydro-N-acetylmuramic acid kinase
MTITIGLMSGTSVDGIDAALVDITSSATEPKIELIAGETYAYPPELRDRILDVCGGASLSMEEFAELDDAIATQFALAARSIQTDRQKAELIGSHGQTVFHRPKIVEEGKEIMGYSLQLGRGELIAALTGIPTVDNFRAADIAAFGQGAPLVPKMDVYLFTHPQKIRAVQNLGGIGNVTYLPQKQGENWENGAIGWDTGPANALLDLAVQKLTNDKQSYDRNGEWASRGKYCQKLVDRWLQEDFFQQPPPKSTGRELFGAEYLETHWQEARDESLSEADWLATLTELTVRSIVHSYRSFMPQMPDEVYLCGGGSHNLYLRKRLQECLGSIVVATTDDIGIDSDFKEAIAFALLAYWRDRCSFAGNLPKVTGARQAMLLGNIHVPIL